MLFLVCFIYCQTPYQPRRDGKHHIVLIPLFRGKPAYFNTHGRYSVKTNHSCIILVNKQLNRTQPLLCKTCGILH